MQPTKILMTTDTLGGVWTYALELIKALDDWKCEVALAAMGGPLSEDQRLEAASLPNATVYMSEYRLEWMAQPWDDVDRAGVWLCDIAHNFGPDIVHLNTYAHATLPFSAPCVVVGHSCVLSWWEAVHGQTAPNEWDIYREQVTAGLQAADLVAAPTKSMLATLQRHYGPLANTQVIPNARDPESYRYNLSEKEKIILSIGRIWDEAKNVQALQSVAKDISWPIYVAGEERHPEGGRVSTKGLHPLGFLSSDQVRSYLARASIYALPARYEPFGLSALEAALSGCVLVLGDIPSLREVWGDAAVYVPPSDPDVLRDILQSLIRQPEQIAALADAAHKRALEYSPRRQAWAYWRAYQTLMLQQEQPLMSAVVQA